MIGWERFRGLERRLLLALGPVLLVIALVRVPEPARLLQLFVEAVSWELMLAIPLNFAVVALKVLRWQRLLVARRVDYSFREAWNAFNAASYVALLTPGRIGDVLRVGYLSRDRSLSAVEGTASIVVDRLFDLAVLGCFAGLGLVHFGAQLAGATGAGVWFAAGACVLGLPAFLLVVSSERVLGALFRRFLGVQRGVEPARRFFESARVQLRHGSVSAVVLTFASFFLIYVQAALLAAALRVPLTLFDVVALNALSTLLGLLPVSVSGLGVREVLFATLFPTLGLSAMHGVGYGLLVFGAMYLPMVAYGFVVWQLHPLPRAQAPSEA